MAASAPSSSRRTTGTGTVNYTVLDVTEANEKREVDAYIAAYAKGGEQGRNLPDPDTRHSTKPSSSAPRAEPTSGRGGKAAPGQSVRDEDDRRAPAAVK